MKFSVIIPVYNVKKYLEQCVLSILKQTYKDFELILVDDGSTDGSGDLCDALAQKDARIKVFHSENKGAAAARNIGLYEAQGEYIYFVDSDDFLNGNTLLVDVVDVLGKGDIDYIQFGFSTSNLQGVVERSDFKWSIPQFDSMDIESKIETVVKKEKYLMSPCAKIVRKAFLLENGIEFPCGVLQEDIDWNFAILFKTKNFSILDNTDYVYRKRPDSISHVISNKKMEDYVGILEKWKSCLETSDTRRKESLLGYLAYEYFIALGWISYLKDAQKKRELLGRMKKISSLTRYRLNRKTALCRILYRLTGIRGVSKIFGYYIMHKPKLFKRNIEQAPAI